MIVPGEASESDEEDVRVVTEEALEAIEIVDSAYFLPPHRLGGNGISLVASQFSSTLQNVTEAMTKQLGNLSSRQQQGTGSRGGDGVNSLLHEKLFERNRSLKGNVDAFVEDHVAKVPKELAVLLGSYSKTQVFIQDSVLSMQQANHFCAEALESMDDFVQIGDRIKFPQ